jgi:hypothetical protein
LKVDKSLTLTIYTGPKPDEDYETYSMKIDRAELVKLLIKVIYYTNAEILDVHLNRYIVYEFDSINHVSQNERLAIIKTLEYLKF